MDPIETGVKIRQMISENCHPYDVFHTLIKAKEHIKLAAVKDRRGYNLLHMIVEARKRQYLHVLFYLNIWNDLQDDLTEDGYTPLGLCDKTLPDITGQDLREEYLRFVRLWDGLPPLHRACLGGDLKLVQDLVHTGSDISLTDAIGGTCVLYACASGSAGIVAYLIRKGADPSVANHQGENGMILAVKYGKILVVRMLLLLPFGFPSSHVDKNSMRAVDYCAVNSDIPTMTELHDLGKVNPDGRSLSMAVRYPHRGDLVCHLVTKYSIDCSGRDDRGNTPLLNAVYSGDTSLVKLVLEKGADIQTTNRANCNCLHLAAELGLPGMCELLIHEARARGCLSELLNQQDYYTGLDQTKLYLVRGRDRSRVSFHYVSVNRTLKHLFNKATASGQTDVTQFGQVLNSWEDRSPQKFFLYEQQKLMEGRVNLKIPDMTPLLRACLMDCTEVAVMLLKVGTQIDVTDHFKNTALHLACMTGNLELVQQLQQSGANITAWNHEKMTPIQVAERNGYDLKNYLHCHLTRGGDRGHKAWHYVDSIHAKPQTTGVGGGEISQVSMKMANTPNPASGHSPVPAAMEPSESSKVLTPKVKSGHSSDSKNRQLPEQRQQDQEQSNGSPQTTMMQETKAEGKHILSGPLPTEAGADSQEVEAPTRSSPLSRRKKKNRKKKKVPTATLR